MHQKVVKKMDMQDKSPHVFLSYAREDADKVDDIYQFLKASGINAWMDKHDLIGGQNWNRHIKNMIEKSVVFVAFLSKSSVKKSGIVQQEFRYAIDQQTRLAEGHIYIVPVMIQECMIPNMFGPTHCIDLSKMQGLANLTAAIKSAIAVRKVTEGGDAHINTVNIRLDEFRPIASQSTPVEVTRSQRRSYLMQCHRSRQQWAHTGCTAAIGQKPSLSR